MNEMVSLGDTAISLHKLQPPKPEVPRSAQIPIFRGGGCSGKSKYSKCKDLPKFQFSVCVGGRGPGGGCSGKSKYSKCQDLSKISIWGRGVFWKVKILKVPRSVQISIWGRGCSEKSKPKVARSVQISIFGGGGGSEPNSRTGVFWAI